MRLTPIEVECYAGAKADETPRRFSLEGQTIEVGEVLDRWYQIETKPEWPRADYFKVHAANGRDYLLKHDLESGEWFWGSNGEDLER
jgi:hypothetical protein